MEQRDYLKRQIEQLGRVLGIILAKLLGIKTSGEFSELCETADNELAGEFDLKLSELLKLDNDPFILSISEDNRFNSINIGYLTEIILNMAEKIEDNEQKVELYGKVILLYDYLDRVENAFSIDRNTKKGEILSILDKLIG